MRTEHSLIVADVGSTNTRAWLVHNGEIVERRTAAVGVRDSALARSTLPVRAGLREVLAPLEATGKPSAVVAAGMITSSLGLAEVPHVPAPASAGDLARAAVTIAAPDITSLPITLVPGVRTAAAGEALTEDVMRGEETLIVGLTALGVMTPGAALLNAGSHWKLIQSDERGCIAWSRTSLGGEVVHAVQTATLLTASLPDGPLASIVPSWLDAGAASVARDGLLRTLFGVRLLDQRGTSTPDERFSWLVGACVRDDLQALLRLGLLRAGARLLVSGPGAIPAAWSHLLRQSGCDATALEPAVVERAMVRGASDVSGLRRRAGIADCRSQI
jgi:2-dehydro-3-deoxygalactonokinase